MTDALIAQARELLAKRGTTERHVYHGLIRDWLLSYHLDVPTELVEQAAEITRLRALLPHTADGVLVADCETLYCPKCGREVWEDGCSECKGRITYRCTPCNGSFLEGEQCLSKPKETT